MGLINFNSKYGCGFWEDIIKLKMRLLVIVSEFIFIKNIVPPYCPRKI